MWIWEEHAELVHVLRIFSEPNKPTLRSFFGFSHVGYVEHRRKHGLAGPTSKNRLAAALHAIDALFKDGLRCKLGVLYTLVYDTATEIGEKKICLLCSTLRRVCEANA